MVSRFLSTSSYSWPTCGSSAFKNNFPSYTQEVSLSSTRSPTLLKDCWVILSPLSAVKMGSNPENAKRASISTYTYLHLHTCRGLHAYTHYETFFMPHNYPICDTLYIFGWYILLAIYFTFVSFLESKRPYLDISSKNICGH